MATYELQTKVRKSDNRKSFKIDDRVNEFTIIDDQFYKTNASNHLHLKCKCQCGNTCYERVDHLRDGKRKSCPKCTQDVNNKKIRPFGEMTSYSFITLKSRAVERNLEFDLDMEYLHNLFIEQNRKCALSKMDISIKKLASGRITASLDRIDSKKGYIKGNVQWLHTRVNIMKSNMEEILFINICNLVCKNNQELIQDNFDPSLLNEFSFNEKVSRKEQRLEIEDIQTNNISKSARHPEMDDDIV